MFSGHGIEELPLLLRQLFDILRRNRSIHTLAFNLLKTFLDPFLIVRGKFVIARETEVDCRFDLSLCQGFTFPVDRFGVGLALDNYVGELLVNAALTMSLSWWVITDQVEKQQRPSQSPPHQSH